jgi:hypothetical protein
MKRGKAGSFGMATRFRGWNGIAWPERALQAPSSGRGEGAQYKR